MCIRDRCVCVCVCVVSSLNYLFSLVFCTKQFAKSYTLHIQQNILLNQVYICLFNSQKLHLLRILFHFTVINLCNYVTYITFSIYSKPNSTNFVFFNSGLQVGFFMGRGLITLYVQPTVEVIDLDSRDSILLIISRVQELLDVWNSKMCCIFVCYIMTAGKLVQPACRFYVSDSISNLLPPV